MISEGIRLIPSIKEIHLAKNRISEIGAGNILK